MDAHLYQGRTACVPHLSRATSILSTMSTKSRQKRRDTTLSSLNTTIEALNLAKEVSSITPAKAVFGSVSILLTMIRVCVFSSPMTHLKLTSNQDSMANEGDYIELGLACADVCKALDRGIDGRRSDNFSRSVREAIEQLMT